MTAGWFPISLSRPLTQTETDWPFAGDGSQTRSFCYVSDLIEAFVLFMDTEEKTLQAR